MACASACALAARVAGRSSLIAFCSRWQAARVIMSTTGRIAIARSMGGIIDGAVAEGVERCLSGRAQTTSEGADVRKPIEGGQVLHARLRALRSQPLLDGGRRARDQSSGSGFSVLPRG